MSDISSLRQYLQYHANNNPGAARRAEAQALLNKVGDDGKLDGNFLTGQKVDRGWFRSPDVREQTSNGYTASALNRSILPWWVNSYNSYMASQNRQNTDNTQGPGGGGGGGFNPFAAQEARNKADAIAKYDDEINQANSAINRLGGQEAVGIANAGKAKDRAWQENENSFNESTGRYNMNTKDAIDNIKKTRDQIESDTATKVRSAKGILAAGGAGDSSFAKTVAPYEIAKAASKQQGEAQDAYAKNRRDMDVNYFAVKNAYNKNKDDIQSEYDNRVNSVKQKIAQSRAELLDRVRSANVGKQTANGSSMAAAIASQQGTRDQINRLGTEIDELGRDRSIPIQKVDWKAPDLATYDPKDVTVKDNSEIGGVNDEISPNLRPILSDEEKKKKQQLM